MRENTTKRKIERGEVAIGPNLPLDSPWLVEIIGLVGFEDLEKELRDGSPEK